MFQIFAYNNLMANNRLLSAAEHLKPGEFEAERTGFFPSIKKTLNHNITVDWFYVDALEGGNLGSKAWEDLIMRSRRHAVKKRMQLQTHSIQRQLACQP